MSICCRAEQDGKSWEWKSGEKENGNQLWEQKRFHAEVLHPDQLQLSQKGSRAHSIGQKLVNSVSTEKGKSGVHGK